MFASFYAENTMRGTQILKAENSLGAFVPYSDGSVTPLEWMCLDGTLYVDEQGVPLMVFCHEWLQIRDGTICAVQLTPDLKTATGEPLTLFHGSEAL